MTFLPPPARGVLENEHSGCHGVETVRARKKMPRGFSTVVTSRPKSITSFNRFACPEFLFSRYTPRCCYCCICPPIAPRLFVSRVTHQPPLPPPSLSFGNATPPHCYVSRACFCPLSAVATSSSRDLRSARKMFAPTSWAASLSSSRPLSQAPRIRRGETGAQRWRRA